MLGAAALILFSGWDAAAKKDSACSDIRWDPAVTDRYPGIDDACYDVVKRNGNGVARVKVKVIDMSSHEIVFRFVQPDGTLSDMYQTSFTPDWAAAINGAGLDSGALSFGMTMNAYVPNDYWDVIYDGESGPNFAEAGEPYEGQIDPELAGGAKSIEVRGSVSERGPTAKITPSAVMPAAEGLVPLIGLLEACFLALGGVILLLRRRLL